METYLLGILFALIAGVVVNFGVIMQKLVINKCVEKKDFMKSLVKSPMWVAGLLLQIVVGGLFFYAIAIIFIGPAIVPGLMAGGLIVLTIGSTRILNEKLERQEYIGIFLMIGGIFFLGISELSLDVSKINILDGGFIARLIIFTVIVLAISFCVGILQKKCNQFKGILMATEGGLILSLNTVWSSPGMTVVTHVIAGVVVPEEITMGIVVGIVLLVILAVGITVAQRSLKCGQANILSPITGVPIQIIPVVAFFVVFLSVPSNPFSLVFLIMGLALIGLSSFLLSSKQAQLEEIQVPKKVEKQ